MKILITGAAGFIGSFLSKKLVLNQYQIIGLDNINDYYDVSLKYSRLKTTGIDIEEIKYGEFVESKINKNYKFIKLDLEDRPNINKLFKTEKFDIVCNLAAQAGVRYSLKNPDTYIDSNISGFFNVLKACADYRVKHFIYASSSSVYGLNKKIPFSEDDYVQKPISLYAATKLTNELLASTYNHLYQLPVTGLRFFTVYGPWGRPDMAYFIFTKAILENKTIKVFNNGKLARDFTYIDDIINGIEKILQTVENLKDNNTCEILNIGRGQKINLLDFISEIENTLGKKAIKNYVSMQKGDVYETYADITKLEKKYNYKPIINLKEGIEQFVEWYKKFYF